VAVLVLITGIALPRAAAFSSVAEENARLKERLDVIDGRMGEVERSLLRLRAYEAQLQSFTPEGDHGPIEHTTLTRPGGDMGIPAAAWADALADRTETFLSLFSELEPGLNDQLVKAEELSALERALPSVWPAEGEVTSRFGWRRSPFGTRWRFHSGLDIARRRGVPVLSTADGVVSSAGWDGGFGRAVYVDHGLGVSTAYAHLHHLDVSTGDRVIAGQRIGSMGSTGRSTGPHLHFELRFDGVPVDPADYLPAR
jgi:murein DD-endopeptidase MepM/ murein hydrolase activator NlpD